MSGPDRGSPHEAGSSNHHLGGVGDTDYTPRTIDPATLAGMMISGRWLPQRGSLGARLIADSDLDQVREFARAMVNESGLWWVILDAPASGVSDHDHQQVAGWWREWRAQRSRERVAG